MLHGRLPRQRLEMNSPEDPTQASQSDQLFELPLVVVPLVALWVLSALGAVVNLLGSAGTWHRHIETRVAEKKRYIWLADVEQLEP